MAATVKGSTVEWNNLGIHKNDHISTVISKSIISKL